MAVYIITYDLKENADSQSYQNLINPELSPFGYDIDNGWRWFQP